MNRTTYFKQISEGSTSVFVFKNKESVKGPGFKEKVPFYNPTMQESRDLSIVVDGCCIVGFYLSDSCSDYG